MTSIDRTAVREALEKATRALHWRVIKADHYAAESVRWYVTAADPNWRPDPMKAYANTGIWTDGGLTTEDNAHLIANAPAWLAGLLEELEEAEQRHLKSDACREENWQAAIRERQRADAAEARVKVLEHDVAQAEKSSQEGWAEVARLQERVRELEGLWDESDKWELAERAGHLDRIAALEAENARLQERADLFEGERDSFRDRVVSIALRLDAALKALRWIEHETRTETRTLSARIHAEAVAAIDAALATTPPKESRDE